MEMSGPAAPSDLLEAYGRVRATTERLASVLSAEDQTVQTMPDVSPTKWHRAHVTWFFETFVLGEYATGLPRLRRRRSPTSSTRTTRRSVRATRVPNAACSPGPGSTRSLATARYVDGAMERCSAIRTSPAWPT